MTLTKYRTSPYWKAAIDLGPSLARLADDLPATEEHGLSKILRKLAVELPAAVAADLIDDKAARQPVILKLTAALELVDRIYPALDTAGARAAADALADQLFSDQFGIPASTPGDTALPDATAKPTIAPASGAAPVPAPATVAIEESATPAAPVAPTSVVVTSEPSAS